MVCYVHRTIIVKIAPNASINIYLLRGNIRILIPRL